ncbi:hypothetical protein [Catenovulum maritimum]|uniref:Uncharacterized protein n=1 Tax=Catenovulum maritimum TaxID=1513271 RepID=A0A0J8JMZ1_9ALTE|nr:hypothetical protein [Catenovulum maritimum]KMT65981.1 hypothetical protein XM47_05870 [Catenovulum maritimum]
MKTNILKMTLISAFVASLSTQVQAVDLDDVTMEIAKEEVKRGHKLGLPLRDTILDYMLEKGDITQAEIDAQKVEREAERTELKALRDAGDPEALKAKREELRAKKREDREAMKSYVDENEDLKNSLVEIKKEAKDKLKDQIKDKIRDRKKQNREKIQD